MAAQRVGPPQEGLPSPDLVVQSRLSDLWKQTLALTVLFVAYLVLRNGLAHEPLLPPVSRVLACAVGGLLVALFLHRARTSMGRGWLAHRGLVGTSWVRTDDLSRVTLRQNAGGGTLTLHDGGGRRLDLPARRLDEHPRVRQQLVTDLRARAGKVDLDDASKHLLLGTGTGSDRRRRRR